MGAIIELKPCHSATGDRTRFDACLPVVSTGFLKRIANYAAGVPCRECARAAFEPDGVDSSKTDLWIAARRLGDGELIDRKAEVLQDADG